jgi:hypothetical protein
MIPHHYENKQGEYILQVGPTRRYKINKINSKKWEWTEEILDNNKWLVTSSGIRKLFKDCVFAVEMDNQFKPRVAGYPPLNPWSEPQNQKKTKPITPEQIKPSASIPDKVIEVFNSLISEKYKNGAARILQREIVNQLVAIGFSRNRIFDERLLDVEELYKEAGWEVKYDKPGYDEGFEPYFLFLRKKPNG